MIKPLSNDSIELNRRSTIHRTFADVLGALARRRITIKDIATRTGRTPAQVRRKLRSPDGWTLNDVSDFLLTINCEADPVIVPFDSPGDFTGQTGGNAG